MDNDMQFIKTIFELWLISGVLGPR